MSRLVGFVVAAALIAACGSAPYDGYDVADRVLIAVGQPVDGIDVVDADCERTTMTDEYGFENEIVTCPDGVGSSPIDPDAPLDPDQILLEPSDLPTWLLTALVAEVPASDLHRSLDEIVGTIDALDASCGVDIDDWTDQLRRLGDQSVDLRDRIDDGLGPDDYIGSLHARALGRALFERAVLGTGCRGTGLAEPQPLDELIDDGVLLHTARTGEAVADLDRALGDEPLGRLFDFFSTKPNFEWLRTQVEPIDVIVFGTSQAGNAIQVEQLSSLLDARAGNAFMPGTRVEVQQHWFPQALRYIDPETVIWFVGGLDLLVDCEPSNHEERFLERRDNRNRAFQASGWFRSIDPITVVLGPPGSVNENRGDEMKADEPDPDAIAAHREEYADRLTDAAFCDDQAAIVAETAAELAGDGRDVVIVGMPMSPIVGEYLSDPVDQSSQAVERLETDYLAGIEGVHVVDLSAAMQDAAWWIDFTHLTNDGSTEFTVLVADAVESATS